MERKQILENWLKKVIPSNFRLAPLAGDASFRRYFRIFLEDNTTTYVLMDAPPPEIPQTFIEIAAILAKQDILVPEVIASNLEHGLVLLSDLGDRLYLPELNNSKTLDLTVDDLYAKAFKTLLKIQQCQADVPKFNHDFIKRQFNIFQTWYLEKHKGIVCNHDTRNFFENIESKLIDVILQQPQVFVHRDYHSRNLMVVDHPGPGVIDFQDAMIGPITYDLVSLLQDCYISWPRERVVSWVASFQQQAFDAGLLATKPDNHEFLKWFDWTGLQRHLKNLGIFTRLNYRDEKAHYLKDIPRVLHYIKETCTLYPELKELGEFLKE